MIIFHAHQQPTLNQFHTDSSTLIMGLDTAAAVAAGDAAVFLC